MSYFRMILGLLVGATAASAETLSFAALKPDEQIVMVRRSTGCFHHTETMYQFEAGSKFRMGIVENPTAKKIGSAEKNERETIGVAELTKDDRFGLDCYLLFLRRRFEGTCTTTDEVVVGYYRGGRKIGEERFVDATCAAQGEILEDGRIVQTGDWGGDFPTGVFRAIVPPFMIAMRLKRANQQE